MANPARDVESDTNDNYNDKPLYASKKSMVDGMMDIALLTANANQLRFLIAYNSKSKMYHVSIGLVILSLVIQVVVGIALIFKVYN